MKPSELPPNSRYVSVPATLPHWKRAIDLCCCLLALPVLAACALVGAILMRLTSPGPLLFRQERVGYQGKHFWLYKFRTMHVSADIATHQTHFSELLRSAEPMQKLDTMGDSRLIAGGRLLRASGLDELPQIINVLRGEMSIVGPRPSIPYEYELCTPAQRRRLGSLPGLTGLWQVSGKNQTSFDQMVELDVAYAQRRSLALDLKIMLLTAPVLVGQILETRFRRLRPTQEGQSAAPFTASLMEAGTEFQRFLPGA